MKSIGYTTTRLRSLSMLSAISADHRLSLQLRTVPLIVRHTGDCTIKLATTRAAEWIAVRIDRLHASLTKVPLYVQTYTRFFAQFAHLAMESTLEIDWVEIRDYAAVGVKYPLHLATQEHAVQFHERFQLPIEQDVFVRGVLALRSQHLIERKLRTIAKLRSGGVTDKTKPIQLSIGDRVYTRLETEVLYNAWTRNKVETLKNLSRLHRLLIVACIYAAMTQGWDQAAMAGAAIEVMTSLGKTTSSGASSGLPSSSTGDPPYGTPVDLDHNTWLLGVTVGVPFFAGAVLGLIITDPITRILRFGRRGAICVAGVFSFISVVGSASVYKWEHFLGFRILLGAGMAGKASIVPILLSETSPKNVRGILLVFWQLFVALGLFAGSVANLSVYSLNVHASWRYMFIAAFIPAILLLSLILFSPESPRWLLKESGAYSNDPARSQQLVRDAYLALIDLRGEPVPILAAGEIYLMYTRLIDEQHRLRDELAGRGLTSHVTGPDGASIPKLQHRLKGRVEHIGWWRRANLMFLQPGVTRRAHLAAAAVMISQQLCGINLLAFMSDTFFRYSILHRTRDIIPEDNLKLLGSSVALMGLQLFATIIPLFYIDKTNGRRNLLNWSFPCMAIGFLGSGLVLVGAGDEPSAGRIAGHYTFLAMFIIAYSIGEGPAAFVISAEVFPLINRELGMSLAVFWNFLGAGLLAVVAPALWVKLSQVGVLVLFAGLNLLAWFICYWLVPNTGNEDLEDVYEQLQVPPGFMLWYTSHVLIRRATKVLDWCFKRGSVSWRDCGFGRKLGSPREEYKKSTADNDQPHMDQAHDTSGSEMRRRTGTEPHRS